MSKHGLKADVKGKILLVIGGKGSMEFINKLEEVTGIRVIVERTAEGILLTPLD